MTTVGQKTEIVHEEAVVITDVEKGGSAHGEAHAQAHAIPAKIASPLAIGFGSFALASFILGLYNTGTVTDVPQAALGVAFGVGAIGQGIAGITGLVYGETFVATSMLTFAGFWLSFGIMFSPGAGFLSTAMADPTGHELEMSLGLWQIAFAIPAFFFLLGSLKQPWLIRIVLLLVFLGFLFGGLGAFTGVHGLTKASGWFTFVLSLVAWYVMCAILFTPENTYIRLPVF